MTDEAIGTVIDALAPVVREHIQSAVNGLIGRMDAERASLNQQIAALEERIAVMERSRSKSARYHQATKRRASS